MMKRVLTIVALVGMTVVGVNGVARAQVNGWENMRRSNGSLRPDSYTAGRAVQGSRNGGTRGNHPGMARQQRHQGGHVDRHGHGGVHNQGHFGQGQGYGYQPYYNPYYQPYYRYPTYYYSRPYYLPPAFIPAGQLFGPAAMRRFMGGF